MEALNNQYNTLNRLTTNKLIDVVKNYHQYGYTEELRELALNILEDRGITKIDLQLTGNLENRTYQKANEQYQAYRKNSKVAFVSYILVFAFKIITRFSYSISDSLVSLFLVLTIFFLALYFIYIILSFINQRQFFKILGDSYGPEGALVYLLIGMPFYFFMYFYFRKQMKEKIKEIR
ncbi:hypothetical protein [Neptunitalea lumnitzerae]|uniref:DUF1700 domain-containing protein n=1 Tax=Neptunitalea lumnitzerae TaxID=2965509 RepID=A0ABQ5MFJ8_9FLAO|nr:hypothetical protein [Neptunitalea sp. Y10]GLB47795.1 hypothetical protein Y10_01630 [Neptunitalea sp. Y10]